MREIRRIIWDWNGTLLDDMALCIDIASKMMLEEGLRNDLSAERYRDVFGFPIRSYYEKLGFDLSGDRFEVLARRFVGEYDERVYECDLHPGAREHLLENHRRGARQTILTAARTRSVEHLAQHYRLEHLLDEIVGLDDHFAHSKTDAGRRWFAERRIQATEAMMIGDTIHDHEVASALGVSCQLVSHGHQSHERLVACGCAVTSDLFGDGSKQ